MVKVSVLMPIYKTKEKFLREAVESILKQTFSDFELLILDDCPEDAREDIIRSYADKRIKYYKNDKNLGITPTRNKLLSLAKGEYLAIVDHDDISMPERFAEQVSFLDTHPDVGVVGSNLHKLVSNKDVIMPENDEDIKSCLMMKSAVSHPSAMVRKSLLTKNNIKYEERYSPAEDYRLWSRLIEYTNFYNIQKVLLCYRDWKHNTTHSQNKQMDKAGADISAENIAKYPLLYHKFNFCVATHITKIRLFGFIPFIKIAEKANRKKVFLFEVIPFLNIKKSTKI